MPPTAAASATTALSTSAAGTTAAAAQPQSQSNPLSDAWAAWIEQLVDDRVHRRLSEHYSSPDPPVTPSTSSSSSSSGKRLSLTRSKPRALRQQQLPAAHSPQATPRLSPASTLLSDSDDSVEVVVLEDSDSDSHASPTGKGDEDGWIDEEHTESGLAVASATAGNGGSTSTDDDDDASSTSSSSSSNTDASSVSGSSDRTNHHHHHHPGLTLDRLYRSFRAFKITRERKYAQLVSHLRTVQVLVAQCFLDIEDLKQVTNQLCQHANAQIMSGAAAGYQQQQQPKQTAVVFSGNDQSISASNYSSSTASSSPSSLSSASSAASTINTTPPQSASSQQHTAPISPRHHHSHSTPIVPIRPVASAVEGSAAALRTLLEQCDDPSLVGAYAVSTPSPTAASAAGNNHSASSSSVSSSTSSAMSTNAGSHPPSSTANGHTSAPAASGTSTMAALAHLLESCSPVLSSGKLDSSTPLPSSSSTTRLPISPPRRRAHLTSPSATPLHSSSYSPWPPSMAASPRSPPPKSPRIRVGMPTPLARMAAAANLTSSSSIASSTHSHISPSAVATAHFTHPPPHYPPPTSSSTGAPGPPPTPTRAGTAGDAFRKLAPPPPPPLGWAGSPTAESFASRNASTASLSTAPQYVDPHVFAIMNSPRSRKVGKRGSPGVSSKPSEAEDSGTGSSPMQGVGGGAGQRLAWPALAEHSSPTQASAAPGTGS